MSPVLSSVSPRRSAVGLAQVSLAGVLWGTGGLAVTLIRDAEPLPTLTVSAYRMLVAAVALVVVVLLRRKLRLVVRLLRERPVRALAVGVATAGYQALYFAAVVAAGVGVATVVALGLAPVLLTVAEAVRRRRRPGPTQIAVLLAALGGLVLVGTSGSAGSTGTAPALGVLLAVASGSVYALATAWGETLARTADPIALTTTTTSAGALALLVPGWLAGSAAGTLVPHGPTTVVLLAYLGVGTMALAYGLLYAGLRTTSSSAAVVATLLEPVTAAVLAAILLGERLGAAGIAGTVLILAAVAGLARVDDVRPDGCRGRRRTRRDRRRAGRPRTGPARSTPPADRPE